MTQEKAFEIARQFLGQTLRVDARYAKLSLKTAGMNFRRAVVAAEFGTRHFKIEMCSYDNRIRLTEITTHRKFGYDHRNPLNGFALKEVQQERAIRTDLLDRYIQE